MRATRYGQRQQESQKQQAKKVRCEDCENEIRDTSGISFRKSDHSFFLCCCKKGHHVDGYGRVSKLFYSHERICNDFTPKKHTEQ